MTNKYSEMMEKANDVLRRNKMCSVCKNAREGFTNEDFPKYTIICNITGENRKGQCGMYCPNWK